MKVKFWGVRGSYSISKTSNMKYGCNTTCIEVATDDDEIIVFDSGSGIYNLAESLSKRDIKNKVVHLFFTHAHWDHIQGLQSFNVLFQKDWTIHFYAVKEFGQTSIKSVYDKIFDIHQWPVPKEAFSKNIFFHEFEPESSLMIGNSKIQTTQLNHPGGNTGYRINGNKWSLFFSGDHEHISKYDEKIQNMMQNVDLAIVDSSYIREDYNNHHIGWGHTPIETWTDLGIEYGVKHLVFTHFSVYYNDEFLHQTEIKYKKIVDKKINVTFAYEGLNIEDIYKEYRLNHKNISDWIVDFAQETYMYNDITTILDTILSRARKISYADAGTIYLVENDYTLSFEYTQNDTLFSNSKQNKHIYVNAKIPINDKSIAGYVANNSITLNIDDVYELSKDLPYSFNNSFDKATSYHTQAMLSVPIVGSNSKVIGVMQLINPIKEEKKTNFTKDAIEKIQLLCVVASNSIQKGQASIESLARMLKISELKDPKETGAHVKRVGNIAAELYQEWANRNNIDEEKAKHYKDTIRLAAMLHDVGKVGIPDAILKKPGKLTEDEFRVMKTHCHIGANLFLDSNLPLDNMAYEIAQYHHQKYNGEGYTGSKCVASLKGEDIPLCARITSIADVYDALVSKRCYKEAFDIDFALNILKEESGISFDPKLIECFMSILPTINAIYEKFKEE